MFFIRIKRYKVKVNIQKGLFFLVCLGFFSSNLSCNNSSKPSQRTSPQPTPSNPTPSQPENPTSSENIPPNLNEFCNWGFAGPQKFECRGKTYTYGSVACKSGFYQNVFCESKYSTHGYTCQEDESPDTIACYNILKSIN